MKKLIILFLILSILLLGCKSYTQDNKSPSTAQNPSIGGGCGVSESENQEKKIDAIEDSKDKNEIDIKLSGDVGEVRAIINNH